MAGRIFALPIAAVLAATAIFAGMGLLQSYAETSDGGPLKAASDFDAIAETGARSKAIFVEASRVLTHPRCINCHPATRSPTQGEDMRPHVPLMIASQSSLGPAGLVCSTCHGAENCPDRRQPHEIHSGQRALVVGTGQHGLAGLDGG